MLPSGAPYMHLPVKIEMQKNKCWSTQAVRFRVNLTCSERIENMSLYFCLCTKQ